jgi:hypothetical protein
MYSSVCTFLSETVYWPSYILLPYHLITFATAEGVVNASVSLVWWEIICMAESIIISMCSTALLLFSDVSAIVALNKNW